MNWHGLMVHSLQFPVIKLHSKRANNACRCMFSLLWYFAGAIVLEICLIAEWDGVDFPLAWLFSHLPCNRHRKYTIPFFVCISVHTICDCNRIYGDFHCFTQFFSLNKLKSINSFFLSIFPITFTFIFGKKIKQY